MDKNNVSELYFHLPFCAKRCSYCDFTTAAVAQQDPLIDDYVLALSNFVRRASKEDLLGGIETIYLGGGTPSYLGLKRLSSLIYMISLRVNVSNETEFTLEANPDSFDERLLKDLWSLGVNRYSLGVQSFDDEVLYTLGRLHDARRAQEALSLLQKRDANYSIDLMCGIPGQSMRSWEKTLIQAIGLEIPHVSVYPLTIEQGTPFDKLVRANLLQEPDQDEQADMMLLAQEMLEGSGMRRYEVASYARPGFQSRHNKGYWLDKSYLGIGSGASSLLSLSAYRAFVEKGLITGDLLENDDDIALVRTYCDSKSSEFAQNDAMQVACETLDRYEACAERLMLRMRLREGVPVSEVTEAATLLPQVTKVFDGLMRDGLVECKDDSFVPTQRGWLLGNEMYGRIWGMVCG